MHDPLVVVFEISRLVTVWHREPDDRDSGEVCTQAHRAQDAEGNWHWVFHHGWKFHVHHWKIQVPALQKLRRRLLTRCEWCGGRDRKHDPINVQYGGKVQVPWWRGAKNVYHQDCQSVAYARSQCLCDEPFTFEGGSFGTCASCGKPRYGQIKPHHLAIRRIYASVPVAGRPSLDVLRQIDALAEPGCVRSPRLRHLDKR